MNMNGFSEVNTHDGTVFVEGDMNIEGNLYVTGTYPSGSGGVQNPMIEDLDAGDYLIFNVSEITGVEGVLKTSLIDVQNNDIYYVNEIKGRSDDNKLYISGNVEMTEDLDMTNKSIINLSALTAGIDGYINTPSLHLQNNSLEAVSILTMTNGLIFDSSTTLGTTGQSLILGVGGLVEYADTVTNPLSADLNSAGLNIFNINTIQTTGISSSTGATAFTSVLNMFNDINMSYHDIFNVERLTASHASVSLNLDMIPATEGKAGQVLARNPAYDPLNFGTHKLVWANQSAGGGVTNPMTANLQAGTFNIYDANIVECKNVNIITGGSGLSCGNALFPVPITWGLAQKLTLDPFYKTFNTDYITPATNLGITIDSKAPDGITDSKITLSAPNIILNNSTNLAPSLVTITGDIQITNGSGYIHGNNLIVRGRTAGNVPTNLTLEGITTAINSTTLNITSNANVIVGNTNFTSTVRTNTIDANSGSNISILQNLTLATGRQLRTDLVFADGLRSYTNTDLILTGLLPDNKTQTNIILASPQISLNNQFGPLTQETQVNIAGNIIFNNTVAIPFIQGSNLIIRGRTPANTATPLTIEGTTTTINSSTLQISSTLNNNITGQTNFDRNINLLSTRSININPSMVLYRTYGGGAVFNITDSLTYVKVTDGQAFKGSKTIPLNGLVINDLYTLTLKGLLSTSTSGSMEFAINFGANRACSFSFLNTTMANEGFEFSCELTVRDVGLGTLAVDIGLGKLERNNNPTRIVMATSGVNMSNPAGSLDIFMKPTVNLGTGSVTIYNYRIENI